MARKRRDSSAPKVHKDAEREREGRRESERRGVERVEREGRAGVERYSFTLYRVR